MMILLDFYKKLDLLMVGIWLQIEFVEYFWIYQKENAA